MSPASSGDAPGSQQIKLTGARGRGRHTAQTGSPVDPKPRYLLGLTARGDRDVSKCAQVMLQVTLRALMALTSLTWVPTAQPRSSI